MGPSLSVVLGFGANDYFISGRVLPFGKESATGCNILVQLCFGIGEIKAVVKFCSLHSSC